MPLLNVRLGPEDQRLADELRREGIRISRLVRDAIRAEHARRVGSGRRRQKPSALLAEILRRHPDLPDETHHGIDTTDRHAVREHVAARLRRKKR